MAHLNHKLFTRVIAFCVFLISTQRSLAQSDFAKLDEWMEENTPQMGGRAILVIYKDGKMIYNKSVNDMSRRQKKVIKYVAKKQDKSDDLDAYTLQSRQLIASCSKWLSAALVMTFVDEGRLRLSDTVGYYLPVLSNHGKGKITIQECLSHMTGIQTPPIKESLKEMKNIHNMDQAIAEIADMPMEGEPGTIFHYSNAGLQIAGAVIEKISGKSFEELFAERISKPMGLKNTDFGNKQPAFPAGGASSTPEDYLHFLSVILNNGSLNGKKILTEESIRLMQINRLTGDIKIGYSPAEAVGFGYGFGEWVGPDRKTGDPGKWVTSPGLFGSFPWLDNEKQYCAVLMTFYLNNEGRNNRYLTLKKLADDAIR